MRLLPKQFNRRNTISLFVLSIAIMSSLSLTAQNIAPTGGNEMLTISEDQSPALIGNLLINNVDANGDPLSITNIYSSVPGAFYTNLNNGFINYYSALNFCGVDTIIYYVSDGTVVIHDTLFLTITCINDAPSNGNESISLTEDGTGAITPVLLANNTDPENDPLSIISINSPINGTLTSNGNGTYTYIPNPGYCGTEVVTYQVSDGTNITIDNLTIIVACINDAPTGGNETITVLEDSQSTNSGYLLANDTDPDGNTLTILNITQTGGGSFTLTPTGSVNYTPNLNFCGTDTLVYSITDGANIIQDTLFVIVQCVNDIPSTGNEWVSTDTDVTLNNIVVLANNFDIENGILSVTNPTFPATTAAGGTVTINPDNTLNYTPPAGFQGYDTLIYQVCDDWTPIAGCVYDTLFITVSIDADNDGVIDLIDIDSDNDGIPNTVENSTAMNGGDTDGDGTPDFLDLDSDNDGIFDIYEAGGTDQDGNGMVDYQIDINHNGLNDANEVNPLPLTNTDGDSQPDYQDVDDDGDSVLTTDEYDENNDGVIDDCNGNGIYNYLDAESCTVVVPEIFSPNWDGKNDALVINGIYAYPENELMIFNRWGAPVYKATGYKNDWTGTNEVEQFVEGNELPVGTYFYTLDLKDGSDVLKGYIYLTR